MENYCEMATDCRRKIIANCFGDSKGFVSCESMCDNCLMRKTGRRRIDENKHTAENSTIDNHKNSTISLEKKNSFVSARSIYKASAAVSAVSSIINSLSIVT